MTVSSLQTENKKTILAWSLYDWANSSFTTLILTFVYSTYFSQAIIADATRGATLWGYAVSISGFLLLILGPLTAAIADHTGRLKAWIFATTLLCILGTAAMGLGVPKSDDATIWIVLGGLILANVGFELGIIFYNALLPNAAPERLLGRVSSFGWALGYMGGLVSLFLMLIVFIGAGGIGPFVTLPEDTGWNVRACVPLVIIWIIIFSIPLFLFVPDAKTTGVGIRDAIGMGMRSLIQSVKKLKSEKDWRSFLMGSALYRDGLNTLFTIGGIYAAQQYGMTTAQVLMFGISMNVTAGAGCFITSYVEDKFGSFPVVRFSLIGLVLCGALVLAAPSIPYFIAFALLLGVFVGPVQSASRTLVTRLSTPDQVTENYGLYSLTGRAAAFLGPFCYATATALFDTQKAGMGSIILFWIVGYAFIAKLKATNK